MTDIGIPPMEPLAPIIDQIREIACEELPVPQAMKISLWDDGDYDIWAYHRRGPDEREQIIYDHESGAVIWQHTKLDPEWELPVSDDIPDDEEREVVPKYAIDETRQIATIRPAGKQL